MQMRARALAWSLVGVSALALALCADHVLTLRRIRDAVSASYSQAAAPSEASSRASPLERALAAEQRRLTSEFGPPTSFTGMTGGLSPDKVVWTVSVLVTRKGIAEREAAFSTMGRIKMKRGVR